MRIIFKIILFSLLYACYSGKNNSVLPGYVITIDNNRVFDEPMPLNVLFDSVEVVLPDREANVLLGDLKGVRYNDGFYYLFDQFNQIIKLDAKGKIEKNFTSIGRGPYEYNYLHDVFINKKNEEVVLLVSYPYKLITIDREGNYVQEIKLPVKIGGYERIIKISDTVLLGGYESDKARIFYDMLYYFSKGEISSKKILHQRALDGGIVNNYWAIGTSEKGDVYLGKSVYDTIRTISPEGEIISQPLNLDVGLNFRNMEYRYHYNDWILVNLWVNKKGEIGDYDFFVVYNKHLKQGHVWGADVGLIGQYLCADEENLFYILRPVSLPRLHLDLSDSLGYKNVIRHIKDLNLQEDDNPVILRYHLKKDIGFFL